MPSLRRNTMSRNGAGVIWAVWAVALLFALAIYLPSAHADRWNQATELTFNEPIQIPGNTVLPAGTYWFVLAGRDRNGVEIYNQNGFKLIATLQTITTDRPDHLGKSEVTLAEGNSKQPKALLKWFYPGDMAGHQFVYSPSEEKQLSSE